MTRSCRAVKFLTAIMSATVFATCCPKTTRADEVGEQVYQRALKSSVYIALVKKVGGGYRLFGHASGELIHRTQRLVLTNHHVAGDLEEGDKMIVQFPQYSRARGGAPELIRQRSYYEEKVVRVLRGFPDPDVYEAKLVKSDHFRDTAVIRLDRIPPANFLEVHFADSAPPPGGRVHSIGNRGTSDAGFVYTPGYVRQVTRLHKFGGFETNCRILETTSPGGPGDSGGPMFNDRGEMVGMCASGYSSGGMFNELSYFIEVSEIKAFLKDLRIELPDQSRIPRLNIKKADEVSPVYYDTGEKVYQRAVKSTVAIVYKAKEDDPSSIYANLQFGTGTIIDAKQGLVLSSSSVGANVKEAYVLFPSYDDKGRLIVPREDYVKLLRESRPITAKVLYRDTKRGLSLLKLERVEKGALPLKLAATSPREGAAVHCVGSSAVVSPGLWGYTPGQVRQVARTRTVINSDPPFELDCNTVQTTSPINGGDKGAALLNDRAELVAVTQEFITSKDARGFSLFVDVSEVHAFLKANSVVLTDTNAASSLEGDGGGKEFYDRVVKSTALITYGTRNATGVLIDAQKGYVLTNYHVGDSEGCYVQFPRYENGKIVRDRKPYSDSLPQAYRAKTIFRDRNRGIAVVELQTPPKDVPAIPMASKSLTQGGAAYAIANPTVSNSRFSYVPGKVRAVYSRAIPVLARGKSSDILYRLHSWIVETDLPLNEGDSGGPLINEAGELAGLNFGSTMSVRGQAVLTLEATDTGDRLLAISTDIREIKDLLHEKNIVLSVTAAPPPEPMKDPKKDPPPKKPMASEQDEKASETALLFAKGTLKSNPKRALERLEELVKKYPDTISAREARDLIKQIKER